MRQGRSLSEYQVQKIVFLLTTTDLAMPDIARAIGCTRSAVAKVNQRHRIRDYGKRRTSWTLLTN